ncbi:MAG: hypothetical protein ACI855_004901 [Myxococcota bacterium]|jgi:hypothetical protein
MHSQLQGLPDIVHAILPELARWDLDEETLSDCARCVMRPRSGEAEQPWHFNERTHCCTHHPYLANYLVGRALRRNDVGSERIRERLKHTEGRTQRGLEPPKAYRNRYAVTKATGFGHDEALLCPFRTQAALSCSIWQDRNSTCRTWFCKSSNGLPQKLTWNAIRNVLARIEIDLAEYCAEQVRCPDEDAGPDVWEAWFVHCARVLDGLVPEQAQTLRSDRLSDLVMVAAKRQQAAADRSVPDVLVPSVSSVFPHGEQRRLTGYSQYDGTTLSPHIFSFLANLDGTMTWQRAAVRCFNATGFQVDRALVAHLFTLRIIRIPLQNDDPHSPEAASPEQLFSDW